MPTYRVTYRTGLPMATEDIEADSVTVQAGTGHVVLHRAVLVIGRPREVVVRRLRGQDVERVNRL